MQHFETAGLSTQVWVCFFFFFFLGGGGGVEGGRGAFLSFNLFNSHFQVSNPGPGTILSTNALCPVLNSNERVFRTVEVRIYDGLLYLY